MTNKTAHKNLKVILDKNAQGIAYGGAPAFLDAELDIFLNQALNEIFSNKITGNNPLKAGFESNFFRTSELDKFVATDSGVYAKNTQFNEFVIDDVHASGKRMFILDVNLIIDKQLILCVTLDHGLIKPYKQTIVNTPWIEQPVYMIENNSVYLYIDPLYIEDHPPFDQGYKAKVTYIRQPKQFNYKEPNDELEFADDIMEEIINRAAVIALENIESSRVQTKLQLNNISE